MLYKTYGQKIERLNVYKIQDELPDIGEKAVLILVNRVQNLVVKIDEVWLVRGGNAEKGDENEKNCVHDASRPAEY